MWLAWSSGYGTWANGLPLSVYARDLMTPLGERWNWLAAPFVAEFGRHARSLVRKALADLPYGSGVQGVPHLFLGRRAGASSGRHVRGLSLLPGVEPSASGQELNRSRLVSG
ncbi:hypothetical protein [Kibdelosporangium philippinense]|uniref:hypothetical protein n=1 Tax=Kibdelosporangium philippinense TaxID=211113 RepID=UPI0036196EBD